VDGIHFDYIRYPETDERLLRGAPVGYNATSLERFRRFTGRADTPAPHDPQWLARRRQQVTQLVRRIFLEAKAVNPRLKVSAAVIAWGPPPRSEKDFQDAAPMQRVFQDWHGWLKEGILDLAIPMNYAREADPVVHEWFDGWLRWEKRHKHGRQLVIGLGAYLNPPAAILAQVRRARQPEGKHHADGVSFFSYANLWAPVLMEIEGAQASTSARPAKQDATPRGLFLTRGEPPEAPALSEPAALPRVDWIEQPTRGWLAGVAKEASGTAIDGANVGLKQRGWFRRKRCTIADGNGFFGFADLKPGRYRVWTEAGAKRGPQQEIEVVAGRVARIELVQP
jgi:uncharacterized lipoprotein YddW (UPF0748 family)